MNYGKRSQSRVISPQKTVSDSGLNELKNAAVKTKLMLWFNQKHIEV